MTEALTIVGVVVGIVSTLGGIGAAAWALSRTKGMQLSLDLITAANNELRAEVADAKASHQQCQQAVAKLEGELEILAGGLAERLVGVALKAAEQARTT